MKLAVVLVTAWLITLLQAAVFHRLWHKNLSVKLDFCQPAAVEGETARLKETISNRKYLPLPVLHVKFQMEKSLVFTDSGNFRITDRNYRSDIFSCMPWQEIRRTLEFSCRKRGYYRIDQIDLVSYDLFFLDHFVATLPEDTAMYVYPGRVDPARLTLPLKNLTGQILARQALLQDPFETRGIRSYQPGDPCKSMNWKATAHTGQLQVNVYEPASSWQVTILLDTDSDRVWGDEALTEESIRLCGSMAEALIERGIPVAVYSNGVDCLSGKPSRIEAGADRKHLKAVMELLARLRIAAKAPLSMTALKAMAGIRDLSPEYAERDGRSGGGHTAPEHPVPDSGASASSSGSAVPDSGASASASDAAVPGKDASTSASGGAIPGSGASASDAAVPGETYLPMETLIAFLADSGSEYGSGFGPASSVYVLISPVQRETLSREFDNLCLKSPGSQWVLPRRPDDKLFVTRPGYGELYEWEVPYGSSRIF